MRSSLRFGFRSTEWEEGRCAENAAMHAAWRRAAADAAQLSVFVERALDPRFKGASESSEGPASQMGVVINPRGTSGSGKTELVRRILAEYGWRRDRHDAWDRVEPIYRAGRTHPFAFRLQHPINERRLVAFGHYQVTSGGCDTIRLQDGGLPEVMHLAGEFASRDHDVILEGLRLSSDVALSARLAAAHGLHILLLSTPLERCVQNLVARRRAGRRSLPAIARNTADEHRRTQDACERLRMCATVEVLDFEQALERARELLGLSGARAAA